MKFLDQAILFLLKVVLASMLFAISILLTFGVLFHTLKDCQG